MLLLLPKAPQLLSSGSEQNSKDILTHYQYKIKSGKHQFGWYFISVLLKYSTTRSLILSWSFKERQNRRI
jgi:hypothetical protein